MARTITLRVSDEVYSILLEAARAERRCLSNLIEISALARIIEQQFVDSLEMEEILANKSLMKRIKKGSRDAKARRGRFVD